jgi:tetratricopeptide (TPR) repeat protein
MKQTPAVEESPKEPPTLKFQQQEEPVSQPVSPDELQSPFQIKEENEQELEAEEDEMVVESAEPMNEEDAAEVRSTADELSSIANLLFTSEDNVEEPAVQSFEELEPELMEESVEEETVRDPSQDRTQPIEEEEDDAEELTTETLAELYMNQGLVDKAVKVYQKLLLSDPGNMQILQRLRELNPVVQPEPNPAPEVWIAEAEFSAGHPAAEEDAARKEKARLRKIHILENWLSTLHRERH